MTTYAFDSEADFQRAARAIVRSERTPVNQPKKRARWQGGVGDGGAKLIPYIITEVSGADGNLAVYRDRAPTTKGKKATQPFVAWNIVDDAEEEVLDTTTMRGVVFTNQVVLTSKVSNNGGTVHTTPYIVSGWGGEIFHDCVAAEDIDAGAAGQVKLKYVTNTALDLAGVEQEATVSAVNSLGFALLADQVCDLVTFSDAMQTFKIIIASCP